MEETPPRPMLEVPTLLEQSLPRPRGTWLWYGLGLFLLVVFTSTYLSARSPQLKMIVELFSSAVMLGLMAAMAALAWVTVKKHRGEQEHVEAVAELVQLRRWPQAAAAIEALLSRPTRTAQARIQGIIYLASVLARYNRFEDAIAIHNYLLENVNLDPSTSHAIRLGRAMAMLREDHLFDADRAISDLRRSPEGEQSAGLALIEIYRDVKTGHPAEAVAMFESKLPILREQLGHRVGDAYGLAAKAYDLLGREDEARAAFAKATLLSPVSELRRRYPELTGGFEAKYPASPAPEGAS